MQNVIGSLEDLNTCVICQNPFTNRDPRLLSCSHIFCMECIEDRQNAMSYPDQVTCPTCDKVTDIDLYELPLYPQADKVERIVSLVRKESTNSYDYDTNNDHTTCKVKLSGHRGRPVIMYCFTCTRAMCSLCKQAHEHNTRFADHVTVSINQTTILSLVCLHHDEFIEAYCMHCCSPVCKTCKLVDHISHDLSAFTVHTTDPDDINIDVSTMKDTSVERLKAMSALKKRFENHLDQVDKQITEAAQHRIAQINQQAEALKQEVQDTRLAMIENTLEVKASLKASIKQCKDIESMQKRIAMADLPNISVTGIQDNILSMKKAALPDITFKMPDEYCYQFQLEETCGQLGKLSKSPAVCSYRQVMKQHEERERQLDKEEPQKQSELQLIDLQILGFSELFDSQEVEIHPTRNESIIQEAADLDLEREVELEQNGTEKCKPTPPQHELKCIDLQTQKGSKLQNAQKQTELQLFASELGLSDSASRL